MEIYAAKMGIDVTPMSRFTNVRLRLHISSYLVFSKFGGGVAGNFICEKVSQS